MIDDKKIEKAAANYAEENQLYIEDQMGDMQNGIEELSEAYKTGAHWAIKEFLKGLLHPACEVPRNDNGSVLAFSREIGYKNLYNMHDLMANTTCDTYQEMWEVEVKAYHLDGWIYAGKLFDLIIKGGEK